jgi:hypothetical protein
MALLSVRAVLSRGRRRRCDARRSFLENPVKLPFLNIELPLLAFYFVAPILFIIVHAYTLVHLVMLGDKARRFHEALHEQISDDKGLPKEIQERNAAVRAGLRRQLASNIFVQFLPARVKSAGVLSAGFCMGWPGSRLPPAQFYCCC